MKTLKNYLIIESYNIFDEEANKDGKIEVTTTEFASGGRESNNVDWEVEQLSDEGSYFNVRATVVNSDIPRKFKKGWYIDFDLDKDVYINDLEDEILRAVDDDRRGAWSSGHY